jgi:hypothetical protein
MLIDRKRQTQRKTMHINIGGVTKSPICANLKFRRPHQKQCTIFCAIFVDDTIPDSRAFWNIPKSKSVVFGGFIGQAPSKNV